MMTFLPYLSKTRRMAPADMFWITEQKQNKRVYRKSAKEPITLSYLKTVESDRTGNTDLLNTMKRYLRSKQHYNDIIEWEWMRP